MAVVRCETNQMLRIIVTTVFLLLACGVIATAFVVGPETAWGGLWLNLGTEIIGIALTVAIVEWLFEWRSTQEEARKMAWRILHTLDHAVWVWQGGHREFDLDELLALLSAVGPNDEIPDFTQNLFIRMGSTSQDTLRHEPGVAKARAALTRALQDLAPLSRIRDNPQLLPALYIAKHLADGAIHAAQSLKMPVPASLPDVSEIRDPDPKRQEWRHFGKVL